MTTLRERLGRAAFGALLGKREPVVDGTLRVAGGHAEVTIRRDAHGIPYVEASCDEDAFFGLGFAQGQDRAGQLEVFVRLVRGTLSEVVGEEGLAIDRLSRSIGFRRAASAQLLTSPERVRAQYEAFARGLNEGRSRGGPLAHDLVLLGTEPSRVVGADLAAIGTFLAFALAANWDIELVRLLMLEEDGEEAVRALEPHYLETLSVASPPGQKAGPVLRAALADLEHLRELVGQGGGSNAWAVSGARTKSGKPLLAADPHLPPALPNSWYVAHARTPEWAASGAMFVGLPGWVVGHNGHSAWAATAAHGDNTDFFLEELSPDGLSVREGDDFVPCTLRRELIAVKGRAPAELLVRETARGPIVTQALELGTRARATALSLAATWLEPRPYEGFLSTHLARGPEAFRRCFEQNSTSGVASVYADVEGRIAYCFSMCVPVRRRGFGTIPLPGWDPRVGWTEARVPPSELPWVLDPEAGLLCAANAQPVRDGEGPFLGVDWLDGYRQTRIADELSRRTDWDVASTQALQRDVVVTPWHSLRPHVEALGGGTTGPRGEPARVELPRAAALAREELLAWDGTASSESEAASLYAAFVSALARRVVSAKAPRSLARALGHGAHPLLPRSTILARRTRHLVELLDRRPGGFFADGWDAAVEAALGDAHDERERRAREVGGKAWGRTRPLVLKHAIGEKRPLDAIYERGPLPGFGDASTIAQGTVDLGEPFGPVVGAPVLRAVIPLGDWDDARFALLGGSSGNPLSPHYDDQLGPWAGEGVRLPFSGEAVREVATHTLRLVPS